MAINAKIRQGGKKITLLAKYLERIKQDAREKIVQCHEHGMQQPFKRDKRENSSLTFCQFWFNLIHALWSNHAEQSKFSVWLCFFFQILYCICECSNIPFFAYGLCGISTGSLVPTICEKQFTWNVHEPLGSLEKHQKFLFWDKDDATVQIS